MGKTVIWHPGDGIKSQYFAVDAEAYIHWGSVRHHNALLIAGGRVEQRNAHPRHPHDFKALFGRAILDGDLDAPDKGIYVCWGDRGTPHIEQYHDKSVAGGAYGAKSQHHDAALFYDGKLKQQAIWHGHSNGQWARDHLATIGRVWFEV